MSFPGQMPQVMKGAIVGIDPFSPLTSICIFRGNLEARPEDEQ